MKKTIWNSEFKAENGILTVTDLTTGKFRTWKIKIDKYCGWAFKVQKTQIKTTVETEEKLLELIEKMSGWLASGLIKEVNKLL